MAGLPLAMPHKRRPTPSAATTDNTRVSAGAEPNIAGHEPCGVIAAVGAGVSPEVLATLPAPRLLVLGDMGEVGEAGVAFHQEVLRHAATLGLDQVLCTGNWFAQSVPGVSDAMGATRLAFFDDFDALQQAVLASSGGAGSVLVKGSRFMRMERVVQAIAALDPASSQPKDSSHAA